MTRPIMLNVCVPGFPGFYESDLSAAIDREEESWLEYRFDGEGDGPDYESAWPEPLRVADLGDLLYRHSDYSEAHSALARDWADAFDYHAGEILGLSVRAKRKVWRGADYVSESWDRPSIRARMESIASPREYNFTTDRLFVDVPLAVMRDLFKRSAADNHETLAAHIRRRFTSRDGFSSFYSNRLSDWIAKPFREWDHNELGTLLIAALEVAGAELDSQGDYWTGFFAEVRETALDGESGMRAWESCVDWAAFDAARAEARADLLAEWLQEEPEAARAWIGGASPEYLDAFPPGDLADVLGTAARCPLTLDMFADLAPVQPEARA